MVCSHLLQDGHGGSVPPSLAQHQTSSLTFYIKLSICSWRTNTVNLGGQYGDRVFDRRGWLGWVAVFGSFDWPVAHFAFDDPGVAACAAFGQGSGEDLNDRLLVSFVDALGGKARGLSGRFGGWRGGRG